MEGRRRKFSAAELGVRLWIGCGGAEGEMWIHPQPTHCHGRKSHLGQQGVPDGVGVWDKAMSGGREVRRGEIHGIHRRWEQGGRESCHRCSATVLGMTLGNWI